MLNTTLKVKIEIAKINGCLRCEGDHEAVTLQKFARPMVDAVGETWAYWFMCPSLNEPVIVKVKP